MKDKDNFLIIDVASTDEKTRQAILKRVLKMFEEALEAMGRADKAAQKASEERKE